MEELNQYHVNIGVLTVRIFLGVLFVMQGYDAVFKIKIRNVIDTYQDSFENKGIPRFLTAFGAWYTSLTELICGALLIIGLFEYVSLYLLAANLLMAAVAFGINTPVWDTRHVFPRLVLTVFLLVVPESWHFLCLDCIIFK
jgi:uncharacterized membrane protein YphA (DoxX/SURF4 family)